MIDEFDLLLGDTNVAKSTLAILDRFNNNRTNENNVNRQFLLAGASFPLKINNIQGLTYLVKEFKDPIIAESENFYKISEKMKHRVLRVSEYL